VQQARQLFGSCLAIAAPRQAHGEHRALAVLAGHSHVATHHACELAGDGKPESSAAAILLCRKSAKTRHSAPTKIFIGKARSNED
jgi:hypothetical protein